MNITPLEQAERLVAEADRILLLSGSQSAALRIERFRALADGFRNTVAFQQGFKAEHEQLCALVSRLLEVLTTRSPHLSRAIREIEGLRDARNNLIEYIQRAKAATPPAGN